jgi:hypothetical protein
MAGDGYVLKSYQYFRITMVVLVAALGFSIVFEALRVDFGCLQGSISAYYYTPVRPIFVGALVAIGTCLIAIKAVDDWEDRLLNIAGVLATIVALVPTGPPELACPADGSKIDLAADTASYVANNVPALIVSGVLACVASYVLAKRAGRGTLVGEDQNLVVGFAIAIALIAGGVGWYFLDQDSFLTKAHGTAAGVMFVLIGVVVVINARRASGRYRAWYTGVVVFMAVAAAAVAAAVGVTKLTGTSWRHAVLLVEIFEIGPFAAFWTVQTVENWNQPIDRAAA